MRLHRMLVVFGAVLVLAVAGGTAAFAAGSAQAGPPGSAYATDAADRAYLGVVIVAINPGIQQAFTLPADLAGVAVLATLPRSPAEAAGIARGDVIVSATGKPTATPKELEEIVRAAAPGSSLVLQVWRAGNVRDVSVTLGQRPAPQRPPRLPRPAPDPLPPVQGPPHWLRHAYEFAKGHPNAIDMTLRFASGDDTVPHVLQLTLGTLATAPSDTQVALQPKLGPLAVFTATPATAYYKGTRKVTQADLAIGDRAVAVVLDGSLRAVVSGPFHQPKPHPQPGRPGRGALPPPRILSPDDDGERRELREQGHDDLRRLREAIKGSRDQAHERRKDLHDQLQDPRRLWPTTTAPAPEPSTTTVQAQA